MFNQLKVAVVTAIAATGILAAGFIAPPGAGARSAHHHKPAISGSAAFALPASGQCLKDGKLTVELRKIRHVAWAGAVVTVNGGRFATIKSSQAGRPVQISGLPSGAIAVSITARTTDHRSTTEARHYHSCAATKPPKSTTPKSTTRTKPSTPTPPTPTPQPTPTPPASTAPQPGRYALSGYTTTLLYVSPDAAAVQDLAKGTSLSCSTGGTIASSISIDEIAIAGDGSFSATEVESSIYSGKPVTVTATVSGQFRGTEAAGTYRQDVAYQDGSGKTCSTNTQSWTAGVDTGQGAQGVAVPQRGRYALSGYTTTVFWVSPDGGHVQDIAKTTSLSCSTGGSFPYSVAIDDIAIEGQTAFGSTEVEHTLIAGKPVKVTTTFRGHFHGLDGNGNQRVAGSYRQDIAYEDGSHETCTTGMQSWSGGVDYGQGSQALAAPQPGRYALSGYTTTVLWVSPDRGHVQDVVKGTSLTCSTGGTLSSSFAITDIPIEAQTTFRTTEEEHTLIAGKPVKVTSTFDGHFHGDDGNGNQRVAGSYREDIAYEDGSGETCTTGTVSWSAGVDYGQGSQALATPQPGRYALSGYTTTVLYVSADGAHAQNVVKGTSLSCSTGGTLSSSISIAEIPIEGEATFAKTQQESAIVSGKQVKITATFMGHFHGLDGNGLQRVAGTYREDIAFEDGSGETCTTGTQSWSGGWASAS
jgi:translation initiation factor 1 (eIF-1/SUI1)